ncbi:MAG: hypothetical protein HC831_18865 [Chloroflexia bacterium]|nr:hypothetical protein [Chloroflexia bacterium]
MPNNVVRTIYEDSNNDIWVGTYRGGLSKYNKSADNFKTISR